MPRRHVPTPPAPRSAQGVRRGRFLGSFSRFRERLLRLRGRARSPGAARRDPVRRVILPRRKGSAALLSVSAVALAGASDIAIRAEAEHTPPAIEQAVFDPAIRRDASELVTSEAMVAALVEEEGVRYRVYRDVAGYPTVGVGHLVLPEDDLRLGQRITHARAMKLLERDLEKAEAGVRDLLAGLPVNQNEFDALVDLVFNVGVGNVSAGESPRLNAAIRAGDYEAIAAELEYTTAAGRIARGLIHRSERRTQIFLDADYDNPRSA